MRTIHYKRKCVSYMCLLGLLSVILTLYIIGLKQSKQMGTNFNLKRPKYKRDTRIDMTRDTENTQVKTRHSKLQRLEKSKIGYHNIDTGLKRNPKEKIWDNELPSAAGQKGSQIEQKNDRGGFLNLDETPGGRGREVNVEVKPVPTSGPKTDKPLNVYIVEEHHEDDRSLPYDISDECLLLAVVAFYWDAWYPVRVNINGLDLMIPYWFIAANKGVIPKSENTLVHIDGHSDLAPTVNIPGYPFFKWPSERQLKYLMQENDAFIQASTMAGLINRVIWVWPDWDRESHDADYVMSTLSLGWVHVDQGKRKSRAFCMCARNETSVECRSWVPSSKEQDDADRDDSDDMFNVDPHLCNIKKTVIVEEIHEGRALVHFGKTNWAARNEHIMLDIDEDFYGCSYAIVPLLQANLSQSRLNHIDISIKSIFCPTNSTHDKESDKFLMELVSMIRKKRACVLDTKISSSATCKDVKNVDTKSLFAKTLQSLVLNDKITLCSRVKVNATKIVNDLAHHFSRLRIKQLRAIQSTGFCANTSPKTYVVRGEGRSFGLCYGVNTPDNSAVVEHTPTPKEIVRRSIILKSILNKLSPQKPGIVTISRSMRDGYTPRIYFEQIEKDVLAALNNTMDRRLRVHYDRDLLGGKPGWPSRHKA